MVTFIYRCPKTGFKVQGWITEEPADARAVVPVACLACNSIHLVNPATGKSPRDEISPDK
jgi:hypothetical protein